VHAHRQLGDLVLGDAVHEAAGLFGALGDVLGEVAGDLAADLAVAERADVEFGDLDVGHAHALAQPRLGIALSPASVRRR
jgi:hypothetical protein